MVVFLGTEKVRVFFHTGLVLVFDLILDFLLEGVEFLFGSFIVGPLYVFDEQFAGFVLVLYEIE